MESKRRDVARAGSLPQEGGVTKVAIDLPEDIDEGTWKEKGRVGGVRLEHEGRRYSLTFYDTIRLQQDAQSDVKLDGYFLEPNIVVVESIDRSHIEAAIQALVDKGGHRMLLPE